MAGPVRKFKTLLNFVNARLQLRRNLNVHEHVSYMLLKNAGISVPNFGTATTKHEAKAVAESLKVSDMVVKAQVLAGGRGKGKFRGGTKGGVQMAYSPQEVEEISGGMLGSHLITKQTGKEGKICNKVMVTERKYPRKEFYFAIMLERAFGGPVLIASSQGGVNIEDVAKETPGAILYYPINIFKGLTEGQAGEIAVRVGLKNVKEQICDMLLKLYGLFIKSDAQLVELNPYAEDVYGKYYALDAKLRFDDNAAFRQKEIFGYRDFSQEDPREVQAQKFGLNYVALDGSIGCLVNGAGLAMAMLDLVTIYGGSPANFLDVGGGATSKAVMEAFKIINTDPKVCSILVNIFGGIMRCDIIAQGIVAAAKDLDIKTPIVCRLQGNNVDEAKFLISCSGLKIIPINNLDEAARLAVKLANIVKIAKSAHLDINLEIPLV